MKRKPPSASTPRHWFTFVDDTSVIQQEAHKQLFLKHIKNIDPAIKFIVEGNQEKGVIPFLDTLVKPEADDSLSISVYRKPTHTDQYLQWDSHQNLASKYSVTCTFTHRAKTVCTGPELFNKETQYLGEDLSKCKYSRWVLDKVQSKFLYSNQEEGNTQEDTTDQRDNSTSSNTMEGTPKAIPSIGNIVIPYTQCLGESIKNICSKYGIQTHFKGNRNLKQLLVNPKDQDPIDRKSGAIYMYQCGEYVCDEEYIGETSRTLWEKYKEHLKEPSPIHVHSTQTGRYTTPENFKIIGREDHCLARIIKESIYIRGNNPTLNRNIGKYNLHHIWDRVLLNTPDLKINSSNGHVHRTCINGHAQSILTNRNIGHTGHALNSEHVHRTS